MTGTVMTVVGKVLMSMAMKLVATEAIEEFLLWLLDKLTKSTESLADDELLDIVRKHLGKDKSKS